MKWYYLSLKQKLLSARQIEPRRALFLILLMQIILIVCAHGYNLNRYYNYWEIRFKAFEKYPMSKMMVLTNHKISKKGDIYSVLVLPDPAAGGN